MEKQKGPEGPVDYALNSSINIKTGDIRAIADERRFPGNDRARLNRFSVAAKIGRAHV